MDDVRIPEGERALLAVAIAGPSNRGKLLASAARVAAATKRKLYICWWPQMYWCSYAGEHSGPWHEMPYKLRDYHDPRIHPDSTEVFEVSPDEAKRHHWLRDFDLAVGDDKKKFDRWIDNVIRDAETDLPVVVVSGWKYLRFESEPDFDFLGDQGNPWTEQKADLVRQVMFYGSRFVLPKFSIEERQTYDIGVQVRVEHDYCHKIPLENFAKAAVEHGRTLEKPVRYLVASDNLAAEKVVCGMILAADPQADVSTRPRSEPDLWARMASGEGLRDLCALAKCDYLVASKGSSFSELAYALAGARRHCVAWVDVGGHSGVFQ